MQLTRETERIVASLSSLFFNKHEELIERISFSSSTVRINERIRGCVKRLTDAFSGIFGKVTISAHERAAAGTSRVSLRNRGGE